MADLVLARHEIELDRLPRDGLRGLRIHFVDPEPLDPAVLGAFELERGTGVVGGPFEGR